ncbi:acyl-CoA carboxylase epsilon subunit [Kineococcus arenarius]|uniref:acyl-CoA carboxylase epsilon subunit n=1 Tax=Kineococcus sp. SYSU DK007 TaxID=3383128 RepID=UPI003D7C6A15
MNGWEVTGHPTDTELAAVLAAVAALRTPTRAPRPLYRDDWGSPASLLRTPFPPPPADPEEDPR